MIDIHTHILYGIDDGSHSLEQSLKMLNIAAKNNTDKIILTPHCNQPGNLNNFYSSDLQNHFDAFREAAKDIPIELYLGMEIYATDEVPDLISEGKIIPLNNSHYLLIEFPFSSNPDWVTHILEEVSKFNLTPVIAHPERYPFIINNPQIIYDWVISGSLIQINKGSLFGRFGYKEELTARKLLNHNLVHFVASDCHSHKVRTPYMMDCYDLISDIYKPGYADLLFNINPKGIINNSKVFVPEPIPFNLNK